MSQSGFVAGTLVHTDQGLVPIEQLKVGDLVGSKAENDPDGELIYQRIKKTHRFEHKSLYMLHVVEEFTDGREPDVSEIFTTLTHLFWKIDIGWVRADLLRSGDEILLANGKTVKLFGWSPVLRTKNSKTGWVAGDLEAMGEINAPSYGYLIDFSHNKIVAPFDDYDQWLKADVIYGDYAANDLAGVQFSDWAYNDTVYNITVEHTYTYFVGEAGIWVQSNH